LLEKFSKEFNRSHLPLSQTFSLALIQLKSARRFSAVCQNQTILDLIHDRRKTTFRAEKLRQQQVFRTLPFQFLMPNRQQTLYSVCFDITFIAVYFFLVK
jgi:hypothetical protein